MKVLFLDHDGVICLERQWGTRFNKQKKYEINTPIMDMSVYDRFDDFDQEAVNILNEVITETDCQIVISSDWKRWATVDEMGDYYESQGIIRKPIDFTPSVIAKDLKFYGGMNIELEETRSYEILQWLDNHPNVKKWVAVDDLDMKKVVNDHSGRWEREWGLVNFVWTVGFGNFGIKEKGKREEIIKYLSP